MEPNGNGNCVFKDGWEQDDPRQFGWADFDCNLKYTFIKTVLQAVKTLYQIIYNDMTKFYLKFSLVLG